MTEEKNHEYVKVYEKQLRKPIIRNSLQLLNTPAKTAHLFFTHYAQSPSNTKMTDNSSQGFGGFLRWWAN